MDEEKTLRYTETVLIAKAAMLDRNSPQEIKDFNNLLDRYTGLLAIDTPKTAGTKVLTEAEMKKQHDKITGIFNKEKPEAMKGKLADDKLSGDISNMDVRSLYNHIKKED